MIASEAETYRINQDHINKIINPIFEKVLIERNQKDNQRLTGWL